MLAAVRAEVARRGLRVQVWVAQTSCMGWCSAEGVTLTFWPKGAFYQGVKVEDVAGLCALHLEPSRG